MSQKVAFATINLDQVGRNLVQFPEDQLEFLNVKSSTTCKPSPKLFQIHFWT